MANQEYSNFYDQQEQNALAKTIPQENDDPDAAARAMELSQSTGIDPVLVYPNLDSIEGQYKAHLIQQMMRNSPEMQGYVNKNPLAAKISADDWGNLHNVSQAMQKIPQESSILSGIKRARELMQAPFDATVNTLMEGLGPQRVGSWIPDSQYNQMMQSPQGRINYALFSMIGAPLEFGLARGPSAIIHGLATGIGAAYDKATGATDTAEKLEQIATDPNTLVMMTGAPIPNVLAMAEPYVARARALVQKSKPYVDAGVEPPVGVDSIIDHAKAEQSKTDVDAIYDALTEAQKSNTKERNPDMFANFIREHNTGEIGINVDAVRRIYGDSVPMPDDGILGWIPGIENQILSSAWDHGDIQVPLADWLAKMDPKVAKELRDFTRVRPGGLTLEEAKLLRPLDLEDPRPPLPEEPAQRIRTLQDMEEAQGLPRAQTQKLVDGMKDSAGLGPRVRLEEVKGAAEEGDHEFDFVDREGNKLGDALVTIDKGNVHVHYMRAVGEDQLWKLGPTVLFDIAKQLKEQFPEIKTFSGYRISGAREGMEEAPLITRPLPRFGPEAHDLFEPLTKTMFGGDTVDFGQGLTAKTTGAFTQNEAAIHDAVNKVLDKITAKLPGRQKVAARDIQLEGETAYGIYSRERNIPFILWSLDSPDAIGTVRHEAIHYLRRNGFFTPREWSQLRDQAIMDDWIGKYDIRRRYPGESLVIRLEEAVAEHFAHINRADYWEDAPHTGVNKIMGKLRNLWEQIRTAVRGVLGKDADYRDVIAKIEKGEIGSREPKEAIGGLRAAQKPGEQLEMPEMTRMEDRDLFAKANALGMTVKSYRQMLEKIAEQDKATTEFANEQNRKQIERRQTKEWKEHEKQIREEVRASMEQRPDLAADKFLREGVLYGDKVQGRPKLNSQMLSDEQKKALPRDYYSPSGIHPDDVASLFGFHSGDELVGRLGQIQTERGNLKPAQHLQKIVAQETAARMLQEHGDLAKNILSEAEDHVISQTQFDLLAEETLAAANRAGMEISLTKEDMKKLAKDNFERMTVKGLRTEAFLRNALKADELGHRALLDDDAAEFARQKQAQTFAIGYAREMKAFEKIQKKFNRLTSKYADRKPSGVGADYTNYIHQIMERFGLDVRRSAADLATEIQEKGYGTLQEFVDHVNQLNQGEALIDDRIMDPSFRKPVGELTVEEFRALNDALVTLDKMGRMDKKVTVAGRLEDVAEVVKGMREQFEAEYKTKKPKERGGPFGDFIRKYLTVGMLNPETWANRFDRDNLYGWWNQAVIRPMATAANRESRLGREYGIRYRDLGEVEDGDRLVRSPLIDPLSITESNPDGSPITGFTRKHVAAMVSNAGNAYNWDVLAKGFGADPTQLKQWLGANTTKADWVRAEKLGKIFNDLFEEAQTVYRNIYGVAPPKIELQPFSINTKDGVFTSEGWYHPIIRDVDRTNAVRPRTGQELLEQDKGMYPSIANGYTKRRTGKIDVLDLSHEMIPYKMQQIVHDIAFRAEIMDVARILRDKSLRFTVKQHLGESYVKMFDSWISDIAGRGNVDGAATQAGVRLSNYLRTNTIGTLIGFNPSTVMKHGPTALINSMYETGPINFIKAMGQTEAGRYRDAVRAIFGGDVNQTNSIRKFIWENSEEIQRRSRHWQESFGGAQKVIEGERGFRERMIEWGSAPVAFSDMISAEPTWLAAYLKEIDDGRSEGDAVFAADRAVRRAHGSTAVTNLPELVRQSGAAGSWMTSLYGFFSTQMQRRAEIAFKLNDTYKLGMEGEIKKASKTLASTVPLIFASVIWPTIVEELVTSIGTDDHRSGLQRLVQAGWTGIAASFLFLRDLQHGVGLGQTVLEDFQKTLKELKDPGRAFDRQHAGKTVQDLITAAGIAKGMSPAQAGRVVRFGMGVRSGTERPSNVRDIGVGLMRGTMKPRVER